MRLRSLELPQYNGSMPTGLSASKILAFDQREQQLADARLLYVAAETGARFVRDRAASNALDWLLTRRALFDGRSAAESCREAESFRRAVVVHGLSLSLDVDPESIRGFPAHHFLSLAEQAQLLPDPRRGPRCTRPRPCGRLELYTCSVSAELNEGHIQIFCAMMAQSPQEVRARLRQRYGSLIEDEAQVRLGFDWSEPLACAMVSEAMAHVLTIAAAEPASSLARGLDFQVEQRFSV